MKGKEIQLEKIKAILDLMDDNYWNNVAARNSELINQAAKLTEAISSACANLLTIQLSILEAKHDGYQRFFETPKPRKTALADIAGKAKEQIGQMTEQKRQAVTVISNLIVDLQTVIKEMESLGELTPGKDGPQKK